MSRNDAAARGGGRETSRKVGAQVRGDVVQVQARLVATRREGAYQYMTFSAPGVPDLARPGQFVALSVGGPTSSLLLRRSFSIHAACAGTEEGEEDILDIVVAAPAPGTQWLISRQVGEVVDLVGPLGRPFPIPRERVSCVLVGGGYGSAALFTLAMALRERGCRVELVLGAATEETLFGVYKASRCADEVTVTTDDGSVGVKGWVSDVLPGIIARSDAAVVYGCGPMAMLESVAKQAAEAGAVSQLAVEESMACGVGVCMTCVLPVVGNDGVTRMVRSCVEGPVFRGDRVRWEAIGQGRCSVPQDALGAPVRPGATGPSLVADEAESPVEQGQPASEQPEAMAEQLPREGGQSLGEPGLETAPRQAGER